MPIFDSIDPGLDQFFALVEQCDVAKLNTFCDKHYKTYCDVYREQEYLSNVEWIVRHFLASKKLALSALFFSQAEYMMSQNMKNLTFYACYYAYFNGLSSNLILSPHLDLRSVRSISHADLESKIENFFVRKGVYSEEALTLLGDLRFARELYSYRLPLRGEKTGGGSGALDAKKLFDRLSDSLPCALQCTNMLSYLSYAAYEKKGRGTPDEYGKFQLEVDAMFHSMVEYWNRQRDRLHYDEGDYNQLGMYFVKLGSPKPIQWTMNDWIQDELECGWEDSEDVEGYSIESASEYLSKVLQK